MAVAVCAAMLLAGYALKAQCLQPWEDFRQYERLCYNDLQPLYGIRGVEQGIFPYVHGSLYGGELVGGAIEYPVLTGTFMWASGLLADDSNEYLKISALLLAPFGLMAAFLLAALAGWRALLWAGAPALIFYSFHNWDLLVVAAVVAGVCAWRRRAYGWTGVWFGIGAALKLYPLFFVVPLALERWRAGDPRGAALSVGAGAGTFALINLPFVIANPEGWLATYRFHSLRVADFNSIWHWAWPTARPHELNLVTLALVAVSFVVAIGLGWWRAGREGTYPFLQVAGAMLAAFLLWNKVHSPQYALWILPFFVLIRVNVAWWALYAVVDAVLYVAIFRWFYDSFYLGLDVTSAKRALLFAVWARAALLVGLFVTFLLSRLADGVAPRPEAESVSYPSPRVGDVGEAPASP